jgi:ABC-type glycerol-3-phosphate transport system substrate-binding protein
MMRIRTIAAAGLIAVTAATGGAVAAQAASTPVYSSSTKVVYVTSPKCLHTHTHTVRYYGYSSKAGGYVKLTRPSTGNSDSYRCQK